MPTWKESFEHAGYALIQATYAPLDDLTTAIASTNESTLRTNGRSIYAARNLLNVPAIADWVQSDAVREIIEPVLGPRAFAVRGILFDKTPTANWKVPWHQDLSIAVNMRADSPGFGPWSIKAGVHHVQPPVTVLENMCTLRLHLDDCGKDNGPLKVVPESHRRRLLDERELARVVTAGPVELCCVPRGGAVVMRPLIAHASSAATRPGHRRVIHIEFANADLSWPLDWHERVSNASLGPRPVFRERLG